MQSTDLLELIVYLFKGYEWLKTRINRLRGNSERIAASDIDQQILDELARHELGIAILQGNISEEMRHFYYTKLPGKTRTRRQINRKQAELVVFEAAKREEFENRLRIRVKHLLLQRGANGKSAEWADFQAEYAHRCPSMIATRI